MWNWIKGWISSQQPDTLHSNTCLAYDTLVLDYTCQYCMAFDCPASRHLSPAPPGITPRTIEDLLDEQWEKEHKHE